MKGEKSVKTIGLLLSVRLGFEVKILSEVVPVLGLEVRVDVPEDPYEVGAGGHDQDQGADSIDVDQDQLSLDREADVLLELVVLGLHLGVEEAVDHRLEA